MSVKHRIMCIPSVAFLHIIHTISFFNMNMNISVFFNLIRYISLVLPYFYNCEIARGIMHALRFMFFFHMRQIYVLFDYNFYSHVCISVCTWNYGIKLFGHNLYEP